MPELCAEEPRLQVINSSEILYMAAITLVKISICLQLQKIFVVIYRNALFWALHVFIVFTVASNASFVLVYIFQCTPRAKIFNPVIPGSCVNIDALIITSAAINVVSDIILLVIPFYFMWNLQLNLHKRLGVAAVFAVGALYVEMFLTFC